MTEPDPRPAPLSPLARVTAIVAVSATVGTVVLLVYGMVAQLTV